MSKYFQDSRGSKLSGACPTDAELPNEGSEAVAWHKSFFVLSRISIVLLILANLPTPFDWNDMDHVFS